MTTTFENLNAGDTIDGPKFAVCRESIRLFCDASLDYNPLHLDDDYMKGNFGKTNFGGIIMHGMNNFGLISRMLTDWAYPAGAIHRRLETRWVKPVRPGDTIQPSGIVKSKQVTEKFALGADRRHGAQPGRREGRDRRGHGRVPGTKLRGSNAKVATPMWNGCASPFQGKRATRKVALDPFVVSPLFDDLDDPSAARLDQNRAAVDDRVAVIANAIFCAVRRSR